jgi:hypothetical protein
MRNMIGNKRNLIAGKIQFVQGCPLFKEVRRNKRDLVVG